MGEVSQQKYTISPPNPFYTREGSYTLATANLLQICDAFEEGLIQRAEKIESKTKSLQKDQNRLYKEKSEEPSTSSTSKDEKDCARRHTDRLHPTIFYNSSTKMEDMSHTTCSLKSGIIHGIYVGEEHLEKCNPFTNNADKLYHYRITVSPLSYFQIRTPTTIYHNERRFTFEGFSLLSHFPLENLPTCKIVRFRTEYTIHYVEDKIPDNFVIRELDLFQTYLFREILELMDLDFKGANDVNGCSRFHFMPRFIRKLPRNREEILAMKEVLQYLLKDSIPLFAGNDEDNMSQLNPYERQNVTDVIKDTVVTCPGKKPCSIRADQLSWKCGKSKLPRIIHFNFPKQSKNFSDQQQITLSAKGFYASALMCDVVEHAVLIPALVYHLRFHYSLNILEDRLNYKFKNRSLLQLALTHRSYQDNFGINPHHVENSLRNCGIRQPGRGKETIRYVNTKQKDVGRLKFLGHAVLRFIPALHLFHLFPEWGENSLTFYRNHLIQNSQLTVLAKTFQLDQFMLYGHNLCRHDYAVANAMARSFQALMGALFIDGGIEVADRVFSEALYKADPNTLEVWRNLPPHPLQKQEPTGDRQWIAKSRVLQKLTKFEDSIGVKFHHIRLLARAFTDENVGYTSLTLGSNQRLEFFGEAIVNLVVSKYLYKNFPDHCIGNLSALRTSITNNRSLAVVCDDLGIENYAIYRNPKPVLTRKDQADLFEAFIAALYVDRDLEFCEVVCEVTLFSRLRDLAITQNNLPQQSPSVLEKMDVD